MLHVGNRNLKEIVYRKFVQKILVNKNIMRINLNLELNNIVYAYKNFEKFIVGRGTKLAEETKN